MSETSFFAATAPGLEGLCARELAGLGVDAVASAGGVEFDGAPAALHAAALHLRTASRLLARVASFRATAFWELEKRAARVDWARFLGPGRAVRLRVTSKRSRLYHENAIAERLYRSIEAATGASAVRDAGEPDPDVDDRAAGPDTTPGEPGQLFVVRVHRDTFTISADASGELLHRRGYRQALARAPLRETLAAAMLLATAWDATVPLVDPFCGSGTLPIEAALLARRVPPGLATAERRPRRHAFMDWPGFDEAAWAAAVEAARSGIQAASPVPIVGSDRDAGAVQAASANAARAGVEHDLALSERALSHLEAPPGRGLLIANPPYGTRVGDADALRDLYAALGNLARRRLRGWTVALLSADRRLEAETGLRFRELLRTRNGGIPVRFVVARAG